MKLERMDAQIISQQEGSVTFVVDPDLPKPEGIFDNKRCNGQELVKYALSANGPSSSVPEILITSLDDKQLYWHGHDVCFQMFVKAYAEHRPLIITPDMMWLLICQGFSHHVNLEPERYRELLVSHNGKQDIVVSLQTDGQYRNDDVEYIVSDFSNQVAKYTQGALASELVADFSTTGPLEQLVSRITMLDAVKSYFEFIHIETICGIPFITLKGTPEDWDSILKRIHRFDAFGLEWWTAKLESILREFVKAAEGHPKASFWKSIVMKHTPDDLRGRECTTWGPPPTRINGWILRFFPYCREGRTPSSVLLDESLLPETVSVPFIHRTLGLSGEVVREEHLEMTAGFFGIEEDPETLALSPVMGWAINRPASDDEIRKTVAGEVTFGGLSLRVKDVPEFLKQFGDLKFLELEFVGPVVLPAWMDGIEIERFTIHGTLTKDEKDAIEKRFKHVRFN